MREIVQLSEITKILIVDDREENLLALEGWLENPDLEIVKACSGNEALGLMLEEDFALVLLDVQMPEMDGFETAELMRMSEKTNSVPIIFVTAISKEQNHVFKGYSAGAVDYLYKPLDPDILKAKVSVFLQLYRQKRSLEVNEQLRSEIASRKLAEATLQTLSLKDALTGLYNRRGFFTLAEQGLKSAQRIGKEMVLIFVDLDNMKAINDTMGHKEGDQALMETAHILKNTFRESDIIARLGGDEFVILTTNDVDASPERMINRFEEALSGHQLHSRRPYTLSMSLGVARFDPQSPCSIDTLLAQADKLMYENKQKKKVLHLNGGSKPAKNEERALYHLPVMKKSEESNRYARIQHEAIELRLSTQD